MLDGSNEMSYSKKMLDFISKGEFIDAQMVLEDVIAHDLPEEKLQLADNLFQLGFLEESEQLFEHLLEVFPSEEGLKISLAEIAIENNDIEKATELLTSIPESSDVYVQSLLTQADLYQILEIPEVSEQKLKQAQKLLPNEPIIQVALAEFYFSMEDYQEAVELYQTVLKENPTLDIGISFYERIGVALSRIAEFEEAIQYLEEALREEETVERLFQLALCYYQLGENERAIELLRQVVSINEDFQQVYYPLGQILFDEGMDEEALNYLEIGIEKNPYEVSLYHLASECAYRLYKKETAIHYLRQAIALEEDSDFSKLRLVDLLRNEEDFDEALSLLSTLENPNLSEAQWYAARLYNDLEEFGQAAVAYEKAAPELLEDAEFLKEYGMFLREEGKIDQSTQLLQAYLKQVPDDMEISDLID
ncbi:tetratricopeptide repeat protein [Vagococcus silagei]|uniref:Tetratricopeptide repeat protein n=2 Tax=Vagococcus silagei TaxID=2508885 RepID=A0A4V3TV30_9ENTE|nr:tetratricopeptide repeat protein [Vagococcus silagei]